MAIERPMTPLTPEDPFEDIEIEIETVTAEGPAMITDTDDGGVIVDFDPSAAEEEVDFYANLADSIEDDELVSIANELLGLYRGDKDSRKDWENTYTRGLDQLGLKHEDRTLPWPGACGVFHPMLTEAVVRFQSQAITELFPSSGPVKTAVLGKLTDDKEEQAIRVQDYMNYLLTEKMSEYRNETEQLLFSLPLAGSAFRKVYYDSNMGRPCSIFVPAEDMVVSYGASELTTAQRIAHVMKKTSNEVRKLQVSGFYRDVELPAPSPDISDVEQKYNELKGDQISYDNDDRHTILEVHVEYDLPGFEDERDGEETGIALPYIITFDLSSRIVLAIRRNWFENDELKQARQHFVHYQYVPGLGFYGFGLIHMIGGLAKSATSLMRQLVDAGTLSNLPGGLKSRGLRIKGDDTPIMPGEFRDVDVPGGTIRDNISFLPYKEPSATLHQLLSNIVEEGRRFASMADLKASDMNSEAPVGTTLAIMERAQKVQSAVQSRLHASMRQELKLLANVIHDFGEPAYPYEIDGQDLKAEDFDDRVDVVPVSDPNAGTMAQRIMQYQAALQLSASAPQLYNMQELHRQMLQVLGIQDVDDIVPNAADIKPADPVSENMNMINESPVQAFEYQDHEAHIKVHMSAMQDPEVTEMAGQSPAAEVIMSSLDSHVREHLAFQYRRQIEQELGTELPPVGEELPEDIEKRLSTMVAEAAEQLLGKKQMQQEAEEAAALAEDPLIQQKERELDIKESDVQRKAQADQLKTQTQQQLAQQRTAIEVERIKSQERIAEAGHEAQERLSQAGHEAQEKLSQAELAQKVASDLMDAEMEDKKISGDQYARGIEIGVDIAKNLIEEDDDQSGRGDAGT